MGERKSVAALRVGSLIERDVDDLVEEIEPALVARVSAAGEVTRQERENGSLHLTVHCGSARDLVPLVIDAARDEAAEVRNIQVLPISLEDVFISLTGRALRE